MRRFIASANAKREIELRFVPSAREECATFHNDTVFRWVIVSEPQQREHLVHRVLHNAFHFRFSDVGVFLFTSARWAVDSSVYVFQLGSCGRREQRCSSLPWLDLGPMTKRRFRIPK